MNNNICVLISSFDGYKDLWMPLEQTYKKYWPDCPYKIYISTNFIKEGFTVFNPIAIGLDKSWSDMMTKTLQNIKEDYVLITFDDLFLYKQFNTQKIITEIEKAISLDMDYFQFATSISRVNKINSTINVKTKGNKYRNSAVWSLWKKTVLLDLLKEGETAWDFEINGNKRSDKYDKFFSSTYELTPYLNGVIKGLWVNDVLRKLEKDNIRIDLTKRKVMSLRQLIIYKFKYLTYSIYNFFSVKI